MGKTEGLKAPVGADNSRITIKAPLADDSAMRSYRRRHKQRPLLTDEFLKPMHTWLTTKMMFPDHNGKFSSPDPIAAEKKVAKFLNGEYLHGKKYWDVLTTTGQSEKFNTGLEVKISSNISSDTPPVLGQVSSNDVLNEENSTAVATVEGSEVVSKKENLDSLDTAEVGRRICRVERLKKEATAKQLRKEGLPAPSHSELCIFWGDRHRQTFTVWTEPYEINEQLADRLIWRRQGKSFQAFEPEVCRKAANSEELKGKHLLEWYPNNGQLRYRVSSPPSGVEVAEISWPDRLYTELELVEIEEPQLRIVRAAEAQRDATPGNTEDEARPVLVEHADGKHDVSPIKVSTEARLQLQNDSIGGDITPGNIAPEAVEQLTQSEVKSRKRILVNQADSKLDIEPGNLSAEARELLQD